MSVTSLAAAAALLVAVLAACTANAAVSSYDPAEAMNSLHYCKAAYCDKSQIASWTCPSCASLHPNFELKGVYNNGTFHGQCFTGYDPTRNQVAVAFRGSADLANWIADFDFVMMPYPDAACTGCEVHTGFYQVYLELASDVLSDVEALLAAHPTATVLVTGHSLGAAVSVHAGVDIARKVTAASGKVSVYNFGDPRVGNPAFVQWATTILPDGKQFRVTHAADPVPHLPPIDFGFLHVPHELWYNNNGDTIYSHCNDSAVAEDPNCSDSVPLPIDVADHTRYLGICTGCDCSDFEAEQAALRKIRVTIPRYPNRKVIVEKLP